MKTMRLGLFLVIGLRIFLCDPCLGDTVRLKNGNVLEGLVENESADAVEVSLGFGSVTLLRNEISSIERSDKAATGKLWDQWNERKKEEKLRQPEIEQAQAQRQAEAERLRLEEENARRQRDEFGPKEASVETQNGHFYVYVLLNDKTRARLILDSGASVIAIPRRVAVRLEIDVASLKKQSVQLADGRVEECGQITLDSVEILSLDSEGSSEPKKTGIKAQNVAALCLSRANDVITQTTDSLYIPDDGLLGMSFLKKFQVRLDYANKKIIFEKNKE